MSVVFISNMSSGHDYSSAGSFGNFRPITTGNFPIFKTERLREEIISALIHSSQEDYLLLSGSSVVAGLCMAVWMMLHGEVKLLLYDRGRGKGAYVVRRIEREKLMIEVEKAKDIHEANVGGEK